MSALSQSFVNQVLGYLNVTSVGGSSVSVPPDSSVEAVNTSSGVGNCPVGTIDTFPVVDIPSFGIAKPTLELPTAPDMTVTGAPSADTTFNQPAIPEDLTITLPPVPSFAPVSLPSAPSYETPTFTETAPTENLSVPAVTFTYAEGEYTSDVLDAVDAELLQRVQQGGYGLDILDELRQWDATRAALNSQSEVVNRQLTSKAAGRNFMYPPGEMFQQLEQAAFDAQSKLSEVSREITAKRADKYTENMRLTEDRALTLEGVKRVMHNAVQERSFAASRMVIDASLAVFNAGVKALQMRLEKYRTAAEVFESRIRAAKLTVEAYKTSVETAHLAVSVQRILAEVYRIQLEGVQTYVTIYRTQMEAAEIAAEIEKLKLDAFKAKVEAYTAQVNAKMAEAQAYEAGIHGQLARVKLYQSEVAAKHAEIEAAKSKIEAQDTLTRSQISANKLKLEAYRANLEKYKAELEAKQTQAMAILELYGADIDKFKAHAHADVMLAKVTNAINKARADMLIGEASISSQYEIGSAKLDVSAAHIASSEKINQEDLASATAVSTAQNVSAQNVSAAANASHEAINTATNSSQTRISTLQNTSSTLISNTRNNYDIALAAAQQASSNWVSNARLNSSGYINGLSYDVYNAEIASKAELTNLKIYYHKV